jgi:hypothetical protein
MQRKPKLDWDFSEDAPDEITVAGYLDALKGCSADYDETTVRVVTPTGRPVKVLGVRSAGRKSVEIVVDR